MFLAELYPATLELVLTIQEDFCWENLYRPFGARSLLGAFNPRLASLALGLTLIAAPQLCFVIRLGSEIDRKRTVGTGNSQASKGLLTPRPPLLSTCV